MAELKIKSRLHNEADILEFDKDELNNEIGTPTEEQIETIAKSAIEADKDVLSKIVYDEETDIVTFPRGILPLRITIEQESEEKPYYFDFGNSNLVDVDNVSTDVYTYYDGEKYILESISSLSQEFRITSLVYINFNGDVMVSYEGFNSYYIFNTQPAGTKLYKHHLVFSDSTNNPPLLVIATTDSPFSVTGGPPKPQIPSGQIISINLYNGGTVICNHTDAGIYTVYQYNPADGTFIQFEYLSSTLVSDTVTPL